MKYIKDFLFSLAVIVGMLAAIFGGGFLVNWVFETFGILGVLGLIAIVSAALSAAMPMNGPPPR